MFFNAKHQKYADIVSLKDPASAKISIKTLNTEFKNAKTRDKQHIIARVTQLAANRAKASLGRKNLSKKERAEFTEINKLYDKAADSFWAQLKK